MGGSYGSTYINQGALEFIAADPNVPDRPLYGGEYSSITTMNVAFDLHV